MVPATLADTVPATLEAAVATAVAGAGLRAPDGVHVAPAIEKQRWSFGTAVLIGTEQGEGPPEVVFYIAHQADQRWHAAIEADATGFTKLVRQAPAGLVPEVFQPAAAGVGAQDWNSIGDLELGMPFRPGEQWVYASGPHAEFGSEAWNSIDLAPEGGGAGGRVHPALGGFATTPCQDNEGTDGGPLVVIKHINGWETHYFHLANTVHLNGVVTEKTVLGLTSARSDGGGCFGTATGPHVHFSLHRTRGSGPSNVAIAGLWLGGWKIGSGPEERDGCLTKRVYYPNESGVYLTTCRGDSIYNNGELGRGAYLKLANIKRGERGEIRMNHMAPRAQVSLDVEYTPKGSKTRKVLHIKTITTNGLGGHRVVKFKVPNGSGMVFSATRVPKNQAGDLYYSVRTNPR